MKSKRTLFRLLQDWSGKPDVHIGNNSISDETYGRQSFLYFWNIQQHWGISRAEFDDLLTGWGFSVNRNYCRGENCTEVQVSYFRGHNWSV